MLCIARSNPTSPRKRGEVKPNIRADSTQSNHALAAPGDPWLISDFPNSRLTTGANQHYSDLVPSLRGALRNVINAGRDAVDAAAQLTNSADAYGQVVSF